MNWEECVTNKMALSPLPDGNRSRRVRISRKLDYPYVEAWDGAGVRRVVHHDWLRPIETAAPEKTEGGEK